MTLKQREILADLHTKICGLEIYLRKLMSQLLILSEWFNAAFTRNEEELIIDEIKELLNLNQSLAELELYLCDFGAKESIKMEARISDPNDPVEDYEIDATLYFTLREDDPEFDEDVDNFLTQRKFSLRHSNGEYGLGDGFDHREIVPSFPVELNEQPQCWLFHDLYDHSYGLEQPALSLNDCLRIGTIWADIAVRHQATLNVKTGKWQQPINLPQT